MERTNVVRGLQAVGVDGHVQDVLNECPKALEFYRVQGFQAFATSDEDLRELLIAGQARIDAGPTLID
jgi:hypothetical protein